YRAYESQVRRSGTDRPGRRFRNGFHLIDPRPQGHRTSADHQQDWTNCGGELLTCPPTFLIRHSVTTASSRQAIRPFLTARRPTSIRHSVVASIPPSTRPKDNSPVPGRLQSPTRMRCCSSFSIKSIRRSHPDECRTLSRESIF